MARQPIYLISPHVGLLVRGNIDLLTRPVVKNRDGSYSTVRSVSFHIEFPRRPKGAEVLVPTVVGNKVVSFQAAWQHYLSTGQHLGIFDTPAHATAYADAVHMWFVRNARLFLKKQRAASR